MMKTNINKQQTVNSKKGFTLLEVIFSIFILTTAVTGPLAFSQSGLRAAFLARDQVVAFALAQDAIENVKNARDVNGLRNTSDWLKDLRTSCVVDLANAPGPGCTLDTSNVLKTVPNSCPTCDPTLYIKRPNGVGTDFEKYTHTNTGDPSKFKRTVYITETVVGREAEVVVIVEWDSSPLLANRRIVVQENIFNWAGNF